MITLTKHHGLGNDFLVCDTSAIEGQPHWPELAQRWCQRRVGIGADGLLLLGFIDPNQLTMTLFNGDGSRAEISGNGIRCLAQAAFMIQGRHGSAEYLVQTDAGPKHVKVECVNAREVVASVSMGLVEILSPPAGWDQIGADAGRPVAHIGLGNPHSVVAVDDISQVDLLSLGQMVPQVNLEIIQCGPTPDSIVMRVHERGAGITQACGSGACASAVAAARWGLASPVNGEIHVHMAGGRATVRLDHPEPGYTTLVGPAVFVATIQIETIETL